MARSTKVTIARKVANAATPQANTVAFSTETALTIVSGLGGIASDIGAAKALFEQARGKQLPFLVLALQGVQPITSEIWERSREAAFAQYQADGVAAGRFKLDAKGISPSARSGFAAIKVCAMALTHGLEPKPGQNLQDFTSDARKRCVTLGLIEGPTQRQQDLAAERAAAAKNPAAPEEASAEKQRAAALALITNNDLALAAKLALCAGEHREAFEAWFAGYLKAINA